MINAKVKKYINKSVLCWLATVNKSNEPNVSPKEMFTFKDDNTLLIANIASPNSIDNIKQNSKVCVSFVDIFVQKGYKIKGIATLIDKKNLEFDQKVTLLTDLFTDKYPIISIIEIKITSVSKILAPSYFLYPDTTEPSQIESAMRTYKVAPSEN